MTVKDGLALTVENTSSNDVSLNSSSVGIEHEVLNLLNNSVFLTSLSGLIVVLSEVVVQVSASDGLLFNFLLFRFSGLMMLISALL